MVQSNINPYLSSSQRLVHLATTRSCPNVTKVRGCQCSSNTPPMLKSDRKIKKEKIDM